MNSPTHKDNIVNSNYTEIGVAVIDGVLDGSETTLVVQFFGKPTQSFIAQKPAVNVVDTSSIEGVKQTEPIITEQSEKTVLEELVVEEVVEEEAEEELPVVPTIFETKLTMAPIKEAVTPEKGGFLGLSSFDLTKVFSLALLGLLLVVLIIDSFLIVKKKVIRIGGKNLVHIAFLVIILIIILLTTAGRII